MPCFGCSAQVLRGEICRNASARGQRCINGINPGLFYGADDTGLNLTSFENWVSCRVLASNADLKASVLAWLPPNIDTRGSTLGEWLVETVEGLLSTLRDLALDVPPPIAYDETSEEQAEVDENPGTGVEQKELLEFLFFHGLSPSYAFPASLSSFLVE